VQGEGVNQGDGVDIEGLLEQSARILRQDTSAGTRLQRLADHLANAVSHYDWFGFYLAVPGERLLVLGPFCGEPTDHLQIPYGRGICGQAAQREETFMVQDIATEDNYLACSPKVQSEMVVPIFHGEMLVGEIDIDSHERASFDDADRRFLDQLARVTAPLVSELSAALAEDERP
jgi:GAF domain-containing protein